MSRYRCHDSIAVIILTNSPNANRAAQDRDTSCGKWERASKRGERERDVAGKLAISLEGDRALHSSHTCVIGMRAANATNADNVELLAGVYGNDFLNGLLLPFNEQDIGHCRYKQVLFCCDYSRFF